MEWNLISLVLSSDYSLITYLDIFVYELAELSSISVDCWYIKPLYIYLGKRCYKNDECSCYMIADANTLNFWIYKNIFSKDIYPLGSALIPSLLSLKFLKATNLLKFMYDHNILYIIYTITLHIIICIMHKIM